MKTIDVMKVAVIALALGAPLGGRVAHAAERKATAASELSAEQTAGAQATKYANIAEQNRQLAAASQARAAESATPSTPAPTGDNPTAPSDVRPSTAESDALAARQYEKLAALAEKLAANARKVAAIHAKAAAALQAQAAVTAKPRR